jgi:hypothetical protein
MLKKKKKKKDSYAIILFLKHKLINKKFFFSSYIFISVEKNQNFNFIKFYKNGCILQLCYHVTRDHIYIM